MLEIKPKGVLSMYEPRYQVINIYLFKTELAIACVLAESVKMLWIDKSEIKALLSRLLALLCTTHTH